MKTNQQILYSFDLSDIASQGTACNWSCNIPSNMVQSKKILQIVNVSTFVLSQQATQIPLYFTINSTVNGGFLDKQGNPSNILAYLIPTQINSNNIQQNVAYNVKFELQQKTVWQIGNASNFILTINALSSSGSLAPVICGGPPMFITLKISKLK